MKKLTLSILMLASVLLSACSAAQGTPTPVVASAPEPVIAEGHITPNEDLRLFFQARGKVSEILVAEGQPVKKGDVLVRLGDREQAGAALTAARLELTQSQQAYDDFTRNEGLSAAGAWESYQQAQVIRAAAQKEWEAVNPNDIQDEIDDADADAKDKKKALEDAQDEFDKYKDLKTDNSTRRKAEDDLLKAQSDYNEALRKIEELERKINGPRAALDAALASEAEALRKYENTKDSLDPEQKALVEARLENAKAQVSAAETALANYDLVAPFDGVVTDVNVTRGELIGSEKYAIQMADFSAWYIETSDLTELEVVDISEGEQVTIVPDALPGSTLNGTVESISLSSKTQGGDVLYMVKIKLIDTDPALRWGMTVEVTFPPK